ncbi:MAG: hypothetical protein BGO59_13895 [Spirosoma sp. 48-14]|nr:MAG: hypothetical protein BGO59_13895 [Spirosoma sp. 48-14]
MTGMFFTFFGTGIAYFGAECHEIACEIRAAGIQSAAKRTNIGAVPAELNTGGHVVAAPIFVAHFQAGSGTAFAGFGAVETGVYVSVLHRFHSHVELYVGRPPLVCQNNYGQSIEFLQNSG